MNSPKQCLELGEQLRQARKRLNLSQAELAKAVGLTQAQVSEAERGDTHVKYLEIVYTGEVKPNTSRLADYLNVVCSEFKETTIRIS